jgi:hypothetical protein
VNLLLIVATGTALQVRGCQGFLLNTIFFKEIIPKQYKVRYKRNEIYSFLVQENFLKT